MSKSGKKCAWEKLKAQIWIHKQKQNYTGIIYSSDLDGVTCNHLATTIGNELRRR